MGASLERSLDDVIETLFHSRNERECGCSLLIGAGCSVEAGIPTAIGFVDLIATHHPAAYERAAKKMTAGRPAYPQCMDELEPGKQRDLINKQVSGARINWAHIAIAQLIKYGYVDRVLTTNFDPLVLRACAMLGVFPAIYDFALSQSFRTGELPERAVFHLHGQCHGFVLINTEKEAAKHSPALGPLFHEAGQARPWIVVGYSGDNDPVFDHLAAVDRFSYGLFWVGFKAEEPGNHVREKLLRRGKSAYLVRGYDADRFFVELAQKLGCFPPELVQRPFSFLKNAMSTLTEYRLPSSGDKEIDILEYPRRLMERAITRIEVPASIELEATALLMAGKHDDLQSRAKSWGDQMPPSVRNLVAWSYIEQCNPLLNQAKTSSEEVDALFCEVFNNYAQALAINANMYAAINNWGLALLDQAQTKIGEEADILFCKAYGKFAEATASKPTRNEALVNWGIALSHQARTKTSEEAEALFRVAHEKYEQALGVKQDDHNVLINWGDTLWAQAKTKTGEEADALFHAAVRNYERALKLKPYDYEALKSWRNLFSYWWSTKNQIEKESMFPEALSLLVAEAKVGLKAYNRACDAAQRGDVDTCRTSLQQAKDHEHLPDKEYLLTDPCLASVRDQAWFRTFLEGL